MVWCGMVWHGMVWYGMVWYVVIWYGMVWYGIVVLCGAVWYGVVWYQTPGGGGGIGWPLPPVACGLWASAYALAAVCASE